jgi:hypothetical protein
MSAPTKSKHKKQSKTKAHNRTNSPLTSSEITATFKAAKVDFEELRDAILTMERELIIFSNDVSKTSDAYPTDKVELIESINTTSTNISKCKGIIEKATNLVNSRAEGFATPEDTLSACFSLGNVFQTLLGEFEDKIRPKYAEITAKLHEYFKKLHPPSEVA